MSEEKSQKQTHGQKLKVGSMRESVFSMCLPLYTISLSLPVVSASLSCLSIFFCLFSSLFLVFLFPLFLSSLAPFDIPLFVRQPTIELCCGAKPNKPRRSRPPRRHNYSWKM